MQSHIETPEAQAYFAEMRTCDRMDLWALKTQIYIEYRLKHLLALKVRAGSDETDFLKELENINYHQLVNLALAAPEHMSLRKDLFKLNNLRKQVAHKFQTTDYIEPLRQFVVSMVPDEPWPQERDQQFEATRTALGLLLADIHFLIRDIEEPGWDKP